MSFSTLGVHAELQKQLLDRNNANVAVDDAALQMLADVVGTRWPYLTSFLSFTCTEIKEAKRGKKPLLFLLTEWKERMHATYGDLCDIMSTLYLQTQPPVQTVDRPSPETTHNSSELLLHTIVDGSGLQWLTSCLVSPESALMGTLLPKILASVCTSSVHTEYVDWNGKKIVLRDIGFSLTVPPGVIPYRQSVEFAVCLSFSGPFVLPDGCELVSPVYFVSAEPEIQLKKQIKLSLDHWANLEDEESCRSLSFVFAPSDPVSEESQSQFHFRPLPGGVFAPGSQTATIMVDHLSKFAVGRETSSLTTDLDVETPVQLLPPLPEIRTGLRLSPTDPHPVAVTFAPTAGSQAQLKSPNLSTT